VIDLRRIQGPPPIPSELKPVEKQKPSQHGEFARHLQEANAAQGGIRFSAHALERMEQRGIGLTPDELKRVNSAVDTAAQKGSRSSLVLLDERAFVISIANRTVITAMEGSNLKDQVVTNIDSTVIL
jgi:flagellar operon protein